MRLLLLLLLLLVLGPLLLLLLHTRHLRSPLRRRRLTFLRPLWPPLVLQYQATLPLLGLQ
jgi:hypothetical protein